MSCLIASSSSINLHCVGTALSVHIQPHNPPTPTPRMLFSYLGTKDESFQLAYISPPLRSVSAFLISTLE